MDRNYAVLGRRFKGYSVFVGEAILVELFEGTNVKESHSFQGTVEKGYKPVDGKFDWMVRTYFVPAGPAR